jgi:hypothetical protein
MALAMHCEVQVALKSVAWLVKCKLKYARNVFITKLIKIAQNEIPHVSAQIITI